ncbi:MAG TPA: ferredoxin [Thermomicrobiaceae bacterium]|nr:ferredoxin [Thermomicrobiaceae bacterium]
MRIRVDRERCIGSENCVASAPSVFQIDADGKVLLLDPGTVDEETLWLAAEICPTEAIVIEDDDGNQLYP